MSTRDSDPFKHSGGDAGDPLVAAYHAVSAEEDAHPQPATRAAILAAAARAVQSRPQPVAPGDAPSVAQGAYASWPGESRRGRWRMPLALAATLMIGVIGWQLAAMFDSAPPADISEASEAKAGAMTAPSEKSVTPDPAAGSPRTEAAPMAASPVSPPATAPAPPAAAAAAKPAPTPPPSTAARTERAPAADKPAAPKLQAVPTTPPPPSPMPAPPPPPPAASGAAAAEPAASADAAAPAAIRAAEVERARREEGAAAGVAAGSAERRLKAAPSAAPPAAAEQQVRTLPVERRRFDEPAARRPLNAWIARVAELRAAGRHAEAQAELQALLRAYPDADLPPEVWPRGAPPSPVPSPSSSDPPAN